MMISILMATYNGGAYLREQLDSLFAQTVQDFTLYASDDNSTDDTFAILEEYAGRYPGRVVALRRAVNSGSAKYNFMDLILAHRQDEYLMLCDQDDVWLPDKIARTMGKLAELEERYGKDVPLIAHTDLTVVDEGLGPVHPSFNRMSRIADIKTLKQAVLQNNITGCTALFNRALASLIEAVPRDFVMHDWWLLLVAVSFGHTGYLPEATILYRQHGGNSVGAMDVHGLGYKWYKLTHMGEIRRSMLSFYRQAASFLDLYGHRLGEEDRRVVSAYASLPQRGKLGRVRVMRREGLLRKGFYRALSQYFFG